MYVDTYVLQVLVCICMYMYLGILLRFPVLEAASSNVSMPNANLMHSSNARPVYIHTYTYICMHIHTNICMHMHTYICMHIRTYAYIYVHMHTYAYIYVHTYAYNLYCIHTHTIYTSNLQPSAACSGCITISSHRRCEICDYIYTYAYIYT